MARSPHQINLDAQLIRRINEQYRGPWARARAPYVQDYLINHSFLNGKPYVRATEAGLQPIPRGPNKYKVRSNINVLKPIVRSILGSLVSGSSTIDVLPATTNFTDEALARVAEQLARSLKRITRHARVTQRNWISLMKGGTTLLRCAWNAGRGVPEETPVTNTDGEPISFDLVDDKERPASEVAEILAQMAEDEGSEAAETAQEIRFVPLTEPTFPGDIELDLYSIMEFMVNPMYLTLDDVDILIVERARSLEWIRANKSFINTDEVQGDSDAIILFDKSGAGVLAPGARIPRVTGIGRNVLQGIAPDFAIVREILIKPTLSNPLTAEFDQNGRLTKDGKPAPLGVHFVSVGNVPLTPPNNPLPYAETPMTDDHDVDFDFSDYRWFAEESFYGSNLLSDGVPLVRSLNRRDSQIKESINATVHAKGLIPAGSRIRKSKITDAAGQWIEYTGEKPSFLEPPTIRSYVLTTVEMDTKHLNDVLMTHEVTRQGSVPANVRTADGLRALQEMDAIPLRPILQEFEASEERTFQMVLDRIKQWYGEDRVILTVGEKNRFEAIEFDRAKFFKYSWRVQIRKGSSLPTSRAAMVAEARETAQYAPWFFVDPETQLPDRALFARAMGRDDLDEILQDEDESRQAAEAEQLQLVQGVAVQVRPFHEHAIHLKVHYALLRSPDWELLEDEIKQITLQHVSEHEQALAQQAQSAAQATGMIQQAAEAGNEAVNVQAAAEAAAARAREIVEEQLEGGQQAPEQAAPQQQPQESIPQGSPRANALAAQILSRQQ